MLEQRQSYQVHYVGTLENGFEFANTWVLGRVVEVVPGQGSFLPAFERAVCGMKRGDRRVITIPAEQAYGSYEEANVVTVPLSNFGNAANLQAGSHVQIRTSAGTARVKVVDIQGGMVTVDCNHELAGHDLTFDIEVISDGTETNIEREMANAGGCSCGCDKLKEQLDPENHSHHHRHGGDRVCAHGHEHAREHKLTPLAARA